MSDDSFSGEYRDDNTQNNDTASMESTDSRSDVTPRNDTKSMNRLFDTLGNDRRRSVLSYLRDTDDEGASVAELTRELATQEANGDGTPSKRRIEDVATSLHHVHLPKLKASGLVNYDVQTGAVRYQENPQVEAVLELVESDAR